MQADSFQIHEQTTEKRRVMGLIFLLLQRPRNGKHCNRVMISAVSKG